MTSHKSKQQSNTRTERIFNLFVFVEHGLISTYGAVCHKINGTEYYKFAYLQSRVEADVLESRRFPIRKSLRHLDSATGILHEGAVSPEWFYRLASWGSHLPIFEEAFVAMNAPSDPLFCITPVVDGIVTVDSAVVLNDPNPGSDPSNPASKEWSHG